MALVVRALLCLRLLLLLLRLLLLLLYFSRISTGSPYDDSPRPGTFD